MPHVANQVRKNEVRCLLTSLRGVLLFLHSALLFRMMPCKLESSTHGRCVGIGIDHSLFSLHSAT